VSPQQTSTDSNALLILQQILTRLERLETKLDNLDERFYRKDYVDQRLKPLEEAAMTKNQRLGLLISAAAAIISTAINIFSHVSMK
jgi:hypothetical protein